MCSQLLSCVQLFAISWTVALQAPLSMGFPRQEYWSGLPIPPPGDLLNSGIESAALGATALAGGFFTTSTTWKALRLHRYIHLSKLRVCILKIYVFCCM